MKIIYGLLLLILLSVPIAAQDDPAESDNSAVSEVFTAVVDVESGFVRALPAFDADVVASVFDKEIVEVVSRNMNGLWFEVRRPHRMTSLGWVFENILEWDFPPESLPLGDFSTGLIGPTVLATRPAYGAYLQEGPALRAQPNRFGEIIYNVPPRITVPVLARNQDGTWLKINYLGYEGWIITFTIRENFDVMNIPEAPGLPPLTTVPIPIIPPEIQLAELNRMRDYIYERSVLAKGLEAFWWRVFRGEVMPCDAPESITNYAYTIQDVRELPELQREIPRLGQGVDYVNAAIDTLNNCGVISPEDVIAARNSAINARVIFDSAIERLDNLEERIR